MFSRIQRNQSKIEGDMSILFRITSVLFLTAAVYVSMSSDVSAQVRGGGGTDEEASKVGELLSEQLSDRLERALDRHPDVAAARAKLALAEAELERVRMEISQEVIRLHLELNAHKLRLKRIIELAKKNAVPQQELIEAKAKLDDLNVRLELLLGRFDANRGSGKHEAKRGGFGSRKRSEEIEIEEEEIVKKSKQIPNEKLRKTLARALYEETEMQFAATPLKEAIEFLAEMHDFNVFFDSDALEADGTDVEGLEVNQIVSGITLKAALVMLEDQIDDIRFVVADYGVVLTVNGSDLDEKYVSVESSDEWAKEAEGYFVGGNTEKKKLPLKKIQAQLAAALHKPVKFDFPQNTTLRAAAKNLLEQCEMPVFFDVGGFSSPVDTYIPSLTVENSTLKSAIELLNELGGQVYFAVTDFGVFVTSEHSPMAQKYHSISTADEWLEKTTNGAESAEAENRDDGLKKEKVESK